METRSGLGVRQTPEARHLGVIQMRPQRTTSIVGRHACQYCGVRFNRSLSGSRPIRFCGQPCYHAWRQENGITTGQFRSGQTPWNRGVTGIHLSPSTEFKAGRTPDRVDPIGTVTIRKAKIGRRQFIKTVDGWTEYAKWLWIEQYGHLLPGDVVHHLNGDRLDDRPENLIALPRTDHPKIHSRWGLRLLSDDELAEYRSRYADAGSLFGDAVTVERPTQLTFQEAAG